MVYLGPWEESSWESGLTTPLGIDLCDRTTRLAVLCPSACRAESRRWVSALGLAILSFQLLPRVWLGLCVCVCACVCVMALLFRLLLPR